MFKAKITPSKNGLKLINKFIKLTALES